MNYYVIAESVWEGLVKDNISFMIKSIDRSKRLVITSETVSDTINQFPRIDELSEYTFTNHTNWVGDGTGITLEEIELNEYISEIDD